MENCAGVDRNAQEIGNPKHLASPTYDHWALHIVLLAVALNETARQPIDPSRPSPGVLPLLPPEQAQPNRNTTSDGGAPSVLAGPK